MWIVYKVMWYMCIVNIYFSYTSVVHPSCASV